MFLKRALRFTLLNCPQTFVLTGKSIFTHVKVTLQNSNKTQYFNNTILVLKY